MRKLLALVLFFVSGFAYAQVPVLVLATFPNQQLGYSQSQVCRQVQVQVPVYQHQHGNIPGAIAGAAIGSQFGNGDGRRAAIVGGAILGYNYRSQYVTPVETRIETICEPISTRTMVTNGYKTTVRLPNGENRMIVLPYEVMVGSTIYMY